MAVDRGGEGLNGSPAERSLRQRAADRLRRLLGLENLAADRGERYEQDGDSQRLAGGPATHGVALGAEAGRSPAAGLAGADPVPTAVPTTEGLPGVAPAPSMAAAAGAVAATALAEPGSMDGAAGAGMIQPGPAPRGGGGVGGGPNSEPAPPLSASGQSSGVAIEDDQLSATGQLVAAGGIHSHIQAGTYRGVYGVLTVESSGRWSYQLDNTDPHVQRLNNGDVAQDHFQCQVVDGRGLQQQVPLVVVVRGTDDAAVISGVRTGAITEDQGAQGVSGQLNASDLDRGDQPSFVAQTLTGSYGTFVLQADGQWQYNADPQKIQGLKEGQQVVETFPLRTTNAQGESVSGSVSITVTGSDDRSVLPAVSLTAKEDGGIVTGRLVATDVDAQTLHYETLPGAPGVPGVSIAADGSVRVDPSQPQFQSLAAGEHRDLQIPVQVVDERGTAVQSLLSVRIDGSNDAPVVMVRPPLPVDEGSGVHSVQVLATDIDTTDTLTYASQSGVPLPPGVSLDAATGLVSIDTNHPAYNSLAVGETRTVVLPVVVSDGHGGSTTTQVSLELHGSNDAPVLAAIGQRTATEGDAPISGQLSAADPDTNDRLTYGVAAGIQLPAGFAIQSDGHWTFDPQNPAYNALRAGDHQQLLIPLQVSDGHGGVSQQILALDLTGSNDRAVISGTSTGSVTEDQTLRVSGRLSVVDPDAGQASFQAGDHIGHYGTLHVSADGSWSYDLDNSKVQGLNNGERVDEPFTVLSADGTAKPLTIQINGSDDSGVISGVRTGAITEDQGAQGVSGQLSARDIDKGDQPSFVSQTLTGSYGSFSLQADGQWQYNADPQKIQGLKEGQQVVETFPLRTTNAQGESVSGSVSITVTGTDDRSVFPAVSLTAKEDGGVVTGRLVATDVDATALHYEAVPGSAGVPGVSIAADGSVRIDPAQPQFQSLAAGEHRDLQIPVQVVDERGTAVQSLLSVRIDGSNDAPVVTVRPPLPVDEGSGVHVVQVLATDVDSSDRLSYATPSGVLLPVGVSLDAATGLVSIDTNHPAYNSLGVGETRTVVVPVVVSDGHGGSTTTQVSLELHGSNDAPVLAVIGQRTATEGDAPISGQLSGVDPDSNDRLTYGVAAGIQLPAGFAIQSDGHWTFDPQDPAYNALRAGDHQQLLIPLQVSDGHGGVSQQTLALDLTGSNDRAVISGTSTGSVTEDRTLQAAGVLSIVDPDAGESQFRPAVLNGLYGQLHLNADGSWTYTLDNTNPRVQALPAGGSLSDQLLVLSADGTAHQVRVQIGGSDDAAQVNGTTTSQVREDVVMTASGQLTVRDIDQGETPRFQSETLQGIYGQLSIDATGQWQYQLDPAASQQLQDGVKARESFTVLASDGKGHQVSQQVLVDITGTNDAARISGTASGQVSEDTLTQASGKLDVQDADRGEAHFVAGDQSGSYGSLHLNADGSWQYTLDNTSPRVQELPAGASATETFTVRTADGTTHQLTVQIAGQNDAARISGTSSGQVSEDTLTQANGKLAVQDTDRGEAHFQAGDQSGSYGSLHLNADGSWQYTLDNTSSQVQSLPAGASATETFTVRAADGTTHQLTVQIAGTNDAATISGTSSGTVTEDGTLQTTGQLQVSDADRQQSAFDASDLGDKIGTYGTLHLNADGSWTYQLNNSAKAVQDLQAGDTRQDSFTVHSVDGTAHTLQMTVVGASDAPVLTAGQLSGGREDNSFTLNQDQILKALQATDPDGDRMSVASVRYAGSDATLVDNHNGTWTLTPHANWAGDLNLQVGVSDGHDTTTGTLTVPIAAVADTVTMTVAPSLSSSFEDPSLGSQPFHFADPTQWGWHTDNASGLVEQGKGETYGDPNHSNTGLIELEGYAGERDNLYRVLDTQPGAAYHFSLDVSGRVGVTTPDGAAVEVLWEGKVIDTIYPAANTFGFVRHEYDLTAHTDNPRVEFRALTHDGSGPIVDNPHFEFRGFNGTEDSPLPIKLSVETADKDGSETTSTSIKGLPAGFVISDGTTGHQLTSSGPTQLLDMQGWDLQHIVVTPLANFHGDVNAVLVATSTEASNHDQSSTQIPVTLNFAGVNDNPTVQITSGVALREGSAATSLEQVSGTDIDGDTTSVDSAWLSSHGWSSTDGGVSYSKAGTYGTATVTVASGQVSYQLNNAAGGATDQLSERQRGRDQFEIQITDGHHGTAVGTAIFNVQGSNDGPMVTAGTATPLAEGSTGTATSILTMRDPDSSDPSPTVDRAWLLNHGWSSTDGGSTYIKAGTYGAATLNVLTSTVSYRLDNTAGGATDRLAVGQSVHDDFSVQVRDVHGATALATPSFGVTGTNDAPLVQAQSTTATEDGHRLTGQMLATDLDSGDTQTFSLGTAVAGLTLNADGSYSFDPTNAAYQHLKAGESQTLTIPVTVSDGSGATARQNLTITITGTNDAPVAQAKHETATEYGVVVKGHVTATDSDTNDTLSFSIAAPVAGLTFHADGSYSFDPSHADYQHLKAGETQTLTIPVTVTDGSGATSRQDLTITVTGGNDAPTVSAATLHPVALAGTSEEHAKTYSSADLLRLIGATDPDGDQLTISDIQVDPAIGSFRASGSDWIFTPATDYATRSGDTIPLTLTVRDAQGATTTAHATTTVSSITDRATASISVSVQHDVMDFGSKASGAPTNDSHVYASVGGGSVREATFEVISVGDPLHPGNPNSDTGPVILNLATSGSNNLVSFWRPANLSIAFNGTDYATNQHLAPGLSGGIDMTTGTHRVTATWDSASGTLRVYDNGVLHNTFTGVLQGRTLDVTANGYLTLGQKMNNYASQSGFNSGEQYSGTIFSASFGTKALSPENVRTGPMANLPAATTDLKANFQSRNGNVVNEVPGSTGGGASFQSSHISHRSEFMDVSAMPPAVGASLRLNLQAAGPADSDDTITRQLLRGLPKDTVLSDGHGHQLTVGASGEVNLTRDLQGWSSLNTLSAQLPTGHNTNVALQLVVETTGPDGVISRTLADTSVLFDPHAAIPVLAPLVPQPSPPPPAPGSQYSQDLQNLLQQLHDAGLDVSETQVATAHHHNDPLTGVASDVLELHTAHGTVVQTLTTHADGTSVVALDTTGLDAAAKSALPAHLSASTTSQPLTVLDQQADAPEQHDSTPALMDHGLDPNQFQLDPVTPTQAQPPQVVDAELLAQAVHQIVTSPDAIDASPGSSNGQVVDPDATPLSSAPDPFIADDTPDPVVVDNVPPPLPPLPEHQQDQSLDHLANLS